MADSKSFGGAIVVAMISASWVLRVVVRVDERAVAIVQLQRRIAQGIDNYERDQFLRKLMGP